jgi:excisionase family DNA binding protein
MPNSTFNDQILTLSEVAEYLKVAEKTILRMIQKGEIPCAKVASQWRFMKPMIDDWLISRMNVLPRNDLSSLLEREGSLVPLSRLIRKEKIIMDLSPGTKEEVLNALIAPLTITQDNRQLFLKKLLQRESMSSTAIGQHVAIPHLRRPEENLIPGPEIILGVCPKGCDFDSIDSKPTHLFFLIITDSEVVHLRILSRISQMAADSDLISHMIQASSPEKILGMILDSEKNERFGNPE